MAPQVDQEKKPLKGRDLRYLKGVGPERVKLLERLGVRTLEDMMYLLPRRYEDRSRLVRIADARGEERRLVVGRIVQKRPIFRRRGRPIFRITVEDGSGRLAGIWFNCAYLDKVFSVGQTVALYGRVEGTGSPQMAHPDYEILAPEDPRRIHTGRIVPVYPLTQDLYQRNVRALQYELLLTHLKDLPDAVPAPVLARHGLVGRRAAMKGIHFPKSVEDLGAAYRRLVFDEFFEIQIALALHKTRTRRASSGAAEPVGPAAKTEFAKLLPFKLTAGQSRAIDDVAADLEKPYPMHRLIQGDVGSGKTTVAAFALWAVARAGGQGALMAPTEILAQQHVLTLSRLFAPAGIAVGFLANGQNEAERARTLAAAASGECRILVGTHALIQGRVNFKRLRLAVIDEQHKFGVSQREFLRKKSDRPNLLVMTATPIPRTLALTLYGDLDVSVMSDAPKGRGRVETVWVGEERRESVYQLLDEELSKGRQAFVVHPVIGAPSGAPLRDARSSWEELKRRFPKHAVALLHGQMKPDEKSRVMREFRMNAAHVLVATTIVEVGVDAPNASVLIVENAERFGLSQLHQLRGRIGRGEHDATCVAFSDASAPAAVERLRAFTQFDSGFDLAEEDLKLRGPGDFLGQRQHGLPPLRIGDLSKDVSLLEAARREAFALVESDPQLARPEHAALKAEVRARFGRVSAAG